jgi:hypothetical protein
LVRRADRAFQLRLAQKLQLRLGMMNQPETRGVVVRDVCVSHSNGNHELVLAHIEQQREQLMQTSFSTWLAADRIDPKARLGFANRLAPIVLGARDFHRHAVEGQGSELLPSLELPAREAIPDRRAQQFVDDLLALGFDLPSSWVEVARALWWSAKIGPTRMLIPRLSALICRARSAEQRQLVLHAIVTADRATASCLRPAALAFEQVHGRRLRFFGTAQLVLQGAAIPTLQIEARQSELSAAELLECVGLVDGVFEAYEAMQEELMEPTSPVDRHLLPNASVRALLYAASKGRAGTSNP